MTPLFKKLNFNNHQAVVLLHAPDSFEAEKAAMADATTFRNDFEPDTNTQFVLLFATKQAEIDAVAIDLAEKTAGDAIIWVAYPKGSSKRYKCDFNRDTGWEVLGKMGFEPVRQVAIDEDWSALRFRRVDYIKTMTRSFAMTETGKEKVAASTALRVVTVPDDFAAALAQQPAAQAMFEKLAYTHRKEYVQWIESAKKAETRANRIAKAVEMVVAKKTIS